MQAGKQNERAACPKDKLEFKLFLSPVSLFSRKHDKRPHLKITCQLFHIQANNLSLPGRFDGIQSLRRWFLLEKLIVLFCVEGIPKFIRNQIESRLRNCCVVLKCAEYELLRS